MRMRILLVHPGASMSTADVYNGLYAGLRALGHEMWDYALDGRIAVAGRYLDYVWKRAKKSDKVPPRPSQADVLYKAGEELVARALRIEPDLVLIVSAMFLHPDVLVLLKRAGLKVAVLFTESPYDDERQVRLLPFIDCAWTNERASARSMGINYLPHAQNSLIHTSDGENGDVPAHDVVFVGTGFQERIDTLSSIDWDGIDFGLYGGWDLLGSRNHLRKYLREGYIDNKKAAQLYRRAKIGLNLYRTSKGFGKDAPQIDYAESLNPRAYELAATGCFSISNHRIEVPEVFGHLVPTFTGAGQIRPLLDRWLADDVGRKKIQAQLPGAVREHTWQQRARQMESNLRDVGIGASRAYAPTQQEPPGARVAGATS